MFGMAGLLVFEPGPTSPGLGKALLHNGGS